MARHPRLLNPHYARFEALEADERRAVFQAAADSHGAFAQAMEKDYWVCRVIDALFKGLSQEPKLFFKGGTSLSKGYGLIHRFSEDIDIVASRAAMLRRCEVDPGTAGLTNSARRRALAEMNDVCRGFVHGPMRKRLAELLPSCEFATDDNSEEHELHVRYEPLFEPYGYQRQYVKIECGARGDGEPSELRSITPYVQDELPAQDDWHLGTPRVTLIRPARTLLEKVVILHIARCRYDANGTVPGDEKYPSRHYYDVAVMHRDGLAVPALSNTKLVEAVLHNQKTIWLTNQAYLQRIRDGSTDILPVDAMLPPLQRDYEQMKGMMFREIPEFEWVLETLNDLQQQMPASALDLRELRSKQEKAKKADSAKGKRR